MRSASYPVRNSAFAVTQVVVTVAVLFIVYRQVAQVSGVAAIGTWATVLAVASLVGIGDLGLPESLARFVPTERVAGRGSSLRGAVASVSLAVLLSTLVLAALAAWPVARLIDTIVASPERAGAHAVLPLALAAVVLMAVANTTLTALEGLQRYDLRCMTVVLGSLAFAAAALAGQPGPEGLARAALLQWLVVLLLSAVCAWREMAPGEPGERRLRWDVLRGLIPFGLSLKVAGVANLALDPVTKSLLAYHGGMAYAGIYEVAARLSVQLRSVIVAGVQVTAPRIAELTAQRGESRRLLDGARSGAFLLATLGFGCLAASLPWLSRLLFGSVSAEFVLFATAAGVAWYVNCLSAPAYFANIGEGRVRWNLYGHVAMAVTNAALGVLLGALFGPPGVVVAAAAAVVVGSALILFDARQVHEPFSPLRRADWLILGHAIATGAVAVWLTVARGDGVAVTGSVVLLVVFAVAGLVYLGGHPLGRALWSRVLRQG